MIESEVLRAVVTKRLRENDADELYRDYLTRHIEGVKEVYQTIMKPLLIREEVSSSILSKIDILIQCHDESKYGPAEWYAYRDHFYDPENNPRSHDIKYNLAWNHHQKCNPHHWNYWCLINDVDTPQIEPLDMPLEYIIEMLCDWQSAGKHYGNTAYQWYRKQGNKMILSTNTRKLIEKYIVNLR